jgi:hypothetical protein
LQLLELERDRLAARELRRLALPPPPSLADAPCEAARASHGL